MSAGDEKEREREVRGDMKRDVRVKSGLYHEDQVRYRLLVRHEPVRM
jgi:hypothetical protein